MSERVSIVEGFARIFNSSESLRICLTVIPGKESLKPLIEYIKKSAFNKKKDNSHIEIFSESSQSFKGSKNSIDGSNSSFLSSIFKSINSSVATLDSKNSYNLDDLFHVSYLKRKNFSNNVFPASFLEFKLLNSLTESNSSRDPDLSVLNSPNLSKLSRVLTDLDNTDLEPTNTILLCRQSLKPIIIVFPSIQSSQVWYKELTYIVRHHQKSLNYPILHSAWPAQFRIKQPKKASDSELKKNKYKHVYLCFTMEEVLIIRESLLHPEFIIEYPFIRQSGTRRDGTFELHLGRASLLGECLLRFKLYNLDEAKNVQIEYIKLIDIRRRIMQQEAINSRKRSFLSTIASQMTHDHDLGPCLPMPSVIKQDCKTDSDSSLNYYMQHKRINSNLSTEIPIPSIEKNLKESTDIGTANLIQALNIHQSSRRRLTISCTSQGPPRNPFNSVKHNLHTNLLQTVSRSMPNPSTSKLSSSSKDIEIFLENALKLPPDQPVLKLVNLIKSHGFKSSTIKAQVYSPAPCSSPLASSENPLKFTKNTNSGQDSQLSNEKIQEIEIMQPRFHQFKMDEGENIPSTLIPIHEASNSGSSNEFHMDTLKDGADEYVDVATAAMITDPEEILRKSSTEVGHLELDQYTRLLADHESSRFAIEPNIHTCRSSSSTCQNAFCSLLSSSNSLSHDDVSRNELAATTNNPQPDHSKIMWILSYLMAMNAKNTTDNEKASDVDMHSTIRSLILLIESFNESAQSSTSVAASLKLVQSILREFHSLENHSEQKQIVNSSSVTSHSQTSINELHNLNENLLKVLSTKRKTVSSCFNHEYILKHPQLRRSSVHVQPTITTDDLACRIIEPSYKNESTSHGFSSIHWDISSSETALSSRHSSNSRTSSFSMTLSSNQLKHNQSSDSGNRANDDLFATVSFNPQSGLIKPDELIKQARARRKLNAMTHSILKQTFLQDPQVGLTAVEEQTEKKKNHENDIDLVQYPPNLQNIFPDNSTDLAADGMFVPRGKKIKHRITQGFKFRFRKPSADVSSVSKIKDISSSEKTCINHKETFDELSGPASVHYGLSKNLGESILPSELPSLYDDSIFGQNAKSGQQKTIFDLVKSAPSG